MLASFLTVGELVILVACVLIAWVMKIYIAEVMAGRRMKSIPRPPGNLLLGNVLDISPDCYEVTFEEWMKSYGEVIIIRVPFGFPNGHLIVTRDPVIGNEIAVIKNLPKGLPNYGWIRAGLGDNLVTLDGQLWKKRRAIMNPAFHNSMLRVLHSSIVRVTLRAMNELIPKSANVKLPESDLFSKYHFVLNSELPKSEVQTIQSTLQKENDDSVLVEVDEWAVNLTFHVILTAVFGDDLMQIDVQTLLTLFNELLEYMNKYMNHHPSGFLPKPHFYNTKGRLVEVLRRMIAARRNKMKETSDDSEERQRDILAMLLETQSKQNNQGAEYVITDDEIISDLLVLLFAGHDTTAHTIAWALFELAQHPEAFNKLKDEVDGLGFFDDAEKSSDGTLPFPDIRFEDINKKLKYTHFVINETLRLHPPAGSIIRHIPEDMTLGGHFVTKDSVVTYSIYAASRHEDIWGPTALQFDPDRFHPDRLTDRQHSATSPFSLGPRNCVGQPLALHELKVVLPLIIAYGLRWKISDTRKQPVPTGPEGKFEYVIQPKAVVTIRPLNGIPLLFNIDKNEMAL